MKCLCCGGTGKCISTGCVYDDRIKETTADCPMCLGTGKTKENTVLIE